MQFLYVFSLMFLSIFGLAVLVKLAEYAVMTRGMRRHDVYVRSGEDISGFVEHVRRSPGVNRVVILSSGDENDEEARRLAQKYSNVYFINDTTKR